MPRKTEIDLRNAVHHAAIAVSANETKIACEEMIECLTGGVNPFLKINGKFTNAFLYNIVNDCPRRVIKGCLDFALARNICIDFNEHPVLGGVPASVNGLQMVALFNSRALPEVCAYIDAAAKKNPKLYKNSKELINQPIYSGRDGELHIIELMTTALHIRNILHTGKFSPEHKEFVLKWAANRGAEPVERPSSYHEKGFIEVELDCNADGIEFLEERGLVSIADVIVRGTKVKQYFPHWNKAIDVTAKDEDQQSWITFVNNFIQRVTPTSIIFDKIFPNGVFITVVNYIGKDPIKFKITYNRDKLLAICNTANEAAMAKEAAEEAKQQHSSGSSTDSTFVRRESIDKLKGEVSALREEHDEIISVKEKKCFLTNLPDLKAQQLYAALRDDFFETLGKPGSRFDFGTIFRDKRVDIAVGAGLAVVALAPHGGQAVATGATLMLNHWQNAQGMAKREEFVFSITSADPTMDAKMKIAMVLAYNLVKSQEGNLYLLTPKQITALKKQAMDLLVSGIHELSGPVKHKHHERGSIHEARYRSNPVLFLTDHIDQGLRKGPEPRAGCAIS